MSGLPFKEKKIGSDCWLRSFSIDEDDDEFVWHRDREDRLIKIISGEGWLIQLDNRLPLELSQGREIFIKKGEWHRVIKGSSDLILKIKKMK